jgi:DNA-directed RNA polymerase specialized sigma subunit
MSESPDEGVNDPRRVPDLEVDGLTEIDIFDQAPVFSTDRVFWDSPDNFDPAALIKDLTMPAWSRRWSDGLCRVWVPEGSGYDAREQIKAWCAERDIEVFNARVEAGVPFRDLDQIEPRLLGGLMAAAVDWLYPRMSQVRRRLVADLDLIEDDDVRSMMYLFVSDVTDRYDSDREGKLGRVNYLAFLIGKMRNWPHDLARATYGRGAVADRLNRSRAVDAFVAEEHRQPTEVELAERLGVTVTELRQRDESLAAMSAMRNYASLSDEGRDEAERFVADDLTEDTAVDYERSAVLSRAIMAAVLDGPKGPDPMALASLYLTYWEGMSKADVARALDVLPKTVSAAVERATSRIDPEGLE